MQKLSIAIITKNEEKNIGRCLKSVNWADEVVVVDSGSIDGTLRICKEFNCKIINSEWLGFGATKQLAVENCANDWIFVIDADEVMTAELKTKIESTLVNPNYSGYRIKRTSYYLGKMIRHCGWDKDYTLRLFNKNKGRFNDRVVHESVQIEDEKIGKIEEPLLHYTYPEIKDHIHKMLTYSKLGSEQKYRKGATSSIVKSMLHGVFKFIKMFILQRGFLDGKEGFILSLNSSFGVYLKYLFIWEKRKTE